MSETSGSAGDEGDANDMLVTCCDLTNDQLHYYDAVITSKS